jgi:RHS repeat-associated protein
LTDHLGSIRDIVNTSGTVLDHLSYDSYGNVLSESNSANGDKFKFDGMQYDDALGIYYVNARWYDPASGKFISLDPLKFHAGDTNLYRYVQNSPTSMTDPTGRIAFAIPVAYYALGVAAAAATAVYAHYLLSVANEQRNQLARYFDELQSRMRISNALEYVDAYRKAKAIYRYGRMLADIMESMNHAQSEANIEGGNKEGQKARHPNADKINELREEKDQIRENIDHLAQSLENVRGNQPTNEVDAEGHDEYQQERIQTIQDNLNELRERVQQINQEIDELL